MGVFWRGLSAIQCHVLRGLSTLLCVVVGVCCGCVLWVCLQGLLFPLSTASTACLPNLPAFIPLPHTHTTQPQVYDTATHRRIAHIPPPEGPGSPETAPRTTLQWHTDALLYISWGSSITVLQTQHSSAPSPASSVLGAAATTVMTVAQLQCSLPVLGAVPIGPDVAYVAPPGSIESSMMASGEEETTQGGVDEQHSFQPQVGVWEACRVHMNGELFVDSRFVYYCSCVYCVCLSCICQ